MTETAAPATEIDPQDFMVKLGSRLRLVYNKETGRHTACFAGVYEKLGNQTKQVVQGIGRSEMEACRALAMRMRDLQRIGRLQVLEAGGDPGPDRIVAPQNSCNTWFKGTN